MLTMLFPGVWRPLRIAAVVLTSGPLALGQVASDPSVLPAFAVTSARVANPAPAGTAAMPVTSLRYEPAVDVQSRNQAEQQADVVLRGGIFENTGFKVGGIALYDPQTGHYLAEIPVAPAMLTSPEILFGARNAVGGFNAGVGTIAYGWRAIENRGELSAAAGDHGFNRQSFYEGRIWPGGAGPWTLASDIEWSRAESDGSRPFGDHQFSRLAGRVQLRAGRSQTDLFAGYQSKFFGWPNLYTPFGFNETESLQTVLVAANHRTGYGGDSWWQAGAYYRRNKDDYEFNRAVPGASNPFQHATHVRGVAIEGRHESAASAAVAYRAAWMGDHLRSTALTFGRYNRRDYRRLAVVPEVERAVAAGRVRLQAGLAYDDTDRDEANLSPILAATLLRADAVGGLTRVHLEYAESSQVATYTALNSNAAAGLFRGNPNLGPQTSRNLELGATFEPADWVIETAVFHRRDDDLVDWTFRRGVIARTANPVDLRVTGWELFVARRTDHLDVVLGYSYLHKDADYRSATIDASFYALNFPRHRLTAAVTWRLGRGWEVRLDNEFRLQEPNVLRTTGGDDAWLSSVGLHYLPPAVPSLELSLLVDNLWNEEFQEVPAVPSGRRQFAAGLAWRW
jgi:vitamin B12 transporter